MAAPERIAIAAEGVDVWRIPLDGSATGDADLLSAAERERAGRFRAEMDRDRFVRSHVALRRILGQYAATGPSDLVFGAGEHGKPFIESPTAARALRFSLSHSGELALLAVARDREVGVDLERVRPVSGMAEMVARYFSAFERPALERIAPAERRRAFFATWVLKEAYLKACGDGLVRRLEDFDVTVGEEPPRLIAVRDRPGDEGRWILSSLDAGEGYVAALAVEYSGRWLRQSHFSGALNTSS